MKPQRNHQRGRAGVLAIVVAIGLAIGVFCFIWLRSHVTLRVGRPGGAPEGSVATQSADPDHELGYKVKWGKDHKKLEYTFRGKKRELPKGMKRGKFPAAGAAPRIDVTREWPVVTIQARWAISTKEWPEKYRPRALDLVLMYLCDAALYKRVFPEAVRSARLDYPPEFIKQAEDLDFRLTESLRGKELKYEIKMPAGFAKPDQMVKTTVRIGLSSDGKTVFWHDHADTVPKHLQVWDSIAALRNVGDRIECQVRMLCVCAAAETPQDDIMRRVTDNTEYVVKRACEEFQRTPTEKEIDAYLELVKNGHVSLDQFLKVHEWLPDAAGEVLSGLLGLVLPPPDADERDDRPTDVAKNTPKGKPAMPTDRTPPPTAPDDKYGCQAKWSKDFEKLEFRFRGKRFELPKDLMSGSFPPAGVAPKIDVSREWPNVDLQARWTMSVKDWPEKYRAHAIDLALMFACDAALYEGIYPDVLHSSRFVYPPEFLKEAEDPNFRLAESLRGKEVKYQINASAGFAAADYDIKSTIRIGFCEEAKAAFYHDRADKISEHLRAREYFFALRDGGDSIYCEAKLLCVCTPRRTFQGETMRRVGNSSEYFVKRIHEVFQHTPTEKGIDGYLALVKNGHATLDQFYKVHGWRPNPGSKKK